MRLKKMALFFVVALVGQISTAAILSSEISGTVKSFDEKNVVLQQASGTVNIPKKYFKNKQLKSGEKVELKLTASELETLFTEQSKAK